MADPSEPKVHEGACDLLRVLYLNIMLRALGLVLALLSVLTLGFLLGAKRRPAPPSLIQAAPVAAVVPEPVMQLPVAPPDILVEPTTETTPEPEAPATQPEAIVTEAEPAPDAATVESIQQHVQSYADQLAALGRQLYDAEAVLREARQEMGRLRFMAERIDGQVKAALKGLPDVRLAHQQQVHGLIDRFQAATDAYSAGYLAADLAQYEAKVLEWEGTLQAHGATLETTVRALSSLDRSVEASWDDSYRLRHELTSRAAELDRLRMLTTPDPALDQMAKSLEQSNARIASLAEFSATAQPEFESRRQELAAAEAALAGWADFQAHWAQYLAGWR